MTTQYVQKGVGGGSSGGTSSSVSAPSSTATITGTPTDGATAVAVTLNSGTALAASGAKLLAIRNNGADKVTVDKDGSLSTVGSNAYLSIGGQVISMGGASVIAIGSGGSLNTMGYATNGSTAIANRIGSFNALTVAGAKIVAFYNDLFSTEKASISKDGKFSCAATNSSGTPGSVTNNSPSGRATIELGTNNVTITNATVASGSLVHVQLETADAGVCGLVTAISAGSFSVTAVNGSGAPTSTTLNATFSFIVFN